MLTLLRRWVRTMARLDSLALRRRLSFAHLRGTGLEIGALHRPLPVRPGVHVRYIDRVARDVSVAAFPELDGSQIVRPTFIGDGLTLPFIRPGTQDFVIANHVVEHAPDPVSAMLAWTETLRDGGALYLTVPIAERCFDKGRTLTTPEHLIDDHLLRRSGNLAEFNRRTEDHFREWATISSKALLAMHGKPDVHFPNGLQAEIDRLAAANAEIHFHTFSVHSFTAFLSLFTSTVATDLTVVTVVDNRDEVIAVLQRTAVAHSSPTHTSPVHISSLPSGRTAVTNTVPDQPLGIANEVWRVVP